MTTDLSQDTQGPAPRPAAGRRRRVLGWIVDAVLFVALAAGVFGLLPRLGGVAHDAAEPRRARPGFNYWLPMPAGAVACLRLLLFAPEGSAARDSTPAARPA